MSSYNPGNILSGLVTLISAGIFLVALLGLAGYGAYSLIFPHRIYETTSR